MAGAVRSVEQDPLFEVECGECGVATDVGPNVSNTVGGAPMRAVEKPGWLPRFCPNCGTALSRPRARSPATGEGA